MKKITALRLWSDIQWGNVETKFGKFCTLNWNSNLGGRTTE